MQRDKMNWPEALASVTVGLAFALNDQPAALVLADVSSTPALPPNLSRAVQFAIRYVTPAALSDTGRARDAAVRALAWLPTAVEAAAIGIHNYSAGVSSGKTETEDDLRTLYEVIDDVVSQLYFNAKRDQDESGISVGFIHAVDPLLESVLSAAEQHGVGLAAATVHRFMELLAAVLELDAQWVLDKAARIIRAGEGAGYTLDGMAVRLVVQIVESVLADHRADVQSGPHLVNLITMLDAFASRGWPEAQLLVWRLEDVFR